MTSLSDEFKTETFEPSLGLKLRHFASNHVLLVMGAAIFSFIVIGALLAPWIATHDPLAIVFPDKLVPPSLDHLMGTDSLGRDIFSRVVFGARTSLMVGVTVTGLAILIGAPIGLLSGYFGGHIDTVLMRISDVFLAFPPLLLPIAITAAIGGGLTNAMFALAVSWFPWYARIMRGSVIRVKNELYISAAKAMGVSHTRIMVRHALPNALTPVVVQGSMDFGYTILAAASLSFIGIGAQPPEMEWGLMAAASRSKFMDFWWTVTFPGLAIFVTVLAVNLVGDGVRDILDPKHEEFK
jgi:peptide/nickel transport system permease protein